MDAKQLLKKAQAALQSMKAELEEKTASLQEFERKELAQDIVQMKIACNVTEPEDFFDEVSELLNSNEDLHQVKLAMRHAGPGFTNTNIVSLSDEAQPSFEADNTPRPAHIKAAHDRLSNVLAGLGVDEVRMVN